MVMPASTSERKSDTPMGSGAMREGGVRPKMSRYQKIDHWVIGNCGPPSGPCWNESMPSTMKGP